MFVFLFLSFSFFSLLYVIAMNFHLALPMSSCTSTNEHHAMTFKVMRLWESILYREKTKIQENRGWDYNSCPIFISSSDLNDYNYESINFNELHFIYLIDMCLLIRKNHAVILLNGVINIKSTRTIGSRGHVLIASI